MERSRNISLLNSTRYATPRQINFADGSIVEAEGPTKTFGFAELKLCDSRKIHCLTREFHVKCHLKNEYRTQRFAIRVMSVKFNVKSLTLVSLATTTDNDRQPTTAKRNKK